MTAFIIMLVNRKEKTYRPLTDDESETFFNQGTWGLFNIPNVNEDVDITIASFNEKVATKDIEKLFGKLDISLVIE